MSNSLLDMIQAIQRNNGNVYLVGGAVRDLVIYGSFDFINGDIDLEIHHLSFDQLFEILSKFGEVNLVGKSFGVFKLYKYPNIDFALARVEKLSGKKHTDFDVDFNSDLTLKQASIRRDFTMNALMLDLFSFELYDFYNGVDDCGNRLLEIVNVDTFIEDPLRVFRAAKFIGRYDFVASSKVYELSKSMILNGFDLSSERVISELRDCFNGVYFVKGLVFLVDIGYISHDLDVVFDMIDCINIDDCSDRYSLVMCLLLFNNIRIDCSKSLVKLYKQFLMLVDRVMSCDFGCKVDYDMFLYCNGYLMSELFCLLLRCIQFVDGYSKIKQLVLFIDQYGLEMVVPFIDGNDLLNIGLIASNDFKNILELCYREQLLGVDRSVILGNLKFDEKG